MSGGEKTDLSRGCGEEVGARDGIIAAIPEENGEYSREDTFAKVVITTLFSDLMNITMHIVAYP